MSIINADYNYHKSQAKRNPIYKIEIYPSKRIFPCIKKRKKKTPIFTSIFPTFPTFPNLQPTTPISEILVHERGSGSLEAVCRLLNPSKGGAKGEKGGCSKKGDEIGCKYAGTYAWMGVDVERGTAPCVVGTCRLGHGCHSRTNIRGIHPWSASAYPEYHIQYQPSNIPARPLPFLAHVNNSRQYFNCAFPPPVIRGVSRLFYHSSSPPPPSPLFLFSKLSYEREYGGSCRYYYSSALYSWLVRSIGCTRWWSLNDRRGTWFMRSTGTVLSFY